MFILNVTLAIILMGAIILIFTRAMRLNKIHIELDSMVKALKSISHNYKEKPLQGKNPLSDTGMLSTLITVIVSKYGSLSLGLQDFQNVAEEEEYVSVYVDPDEQNLILSTNHSLGAPDSVNVAVFGDPDDNTFH